MKLVIVSGLSGSGKSITLNTLEDMGYYCIDNLPIALLDSFADQLTQANSLYQHAAVGIDIRNLSTDLSYFPALLAHLREEKKLEIQILYLQADDAVLFKRFSETRRRHPLTRSNLTLKEAIQSERKLLEPIAVGADFCIDTTHLNVHQLRELLLVQVERTKDFHFSILFQSFGFKNGAPSDTDFVFDVRCLPNPHWDPRLRPLTGKDADVIQYLEQQPLVTEMLGDISKFLHRWIGVFEAENRTYLSISIGCTGGQHRSVYFVERLVKAFELPEGAAKNERQKILLRHRDLK